MERQSGFINALSFLTIVRPGDGGRFDPGAALYWFAPVGLLIGLGLVLVHAVFGVISPVLMVIYLAVITGFLHLDGLADTFDGLFSRKSPAEMLRIMRDSRIGAMGAAALILCLLGKYHAFAGPDNSWLLVAVPSLSRFSMVLLLTALPYVRKKGLGKGFSEEHGRSLYIQAIPAEVIIFFALGPWGWLLVNGTFTAILLGLSAWYKNTIGGITGDTLGAACEIIETALFLMCAWLIV